MDGQERQPNDDGFAEEQAIAPSEPVSSIGLSRRDFARRFGGGSAAAVVGLAWASPKITTIRYVAKAKAGSPPPSSSSTTTTTVPVGELGHIAISSSSPCPGDTIRVTASGFAPRTAVTIEIDSPAHTLGVATASSTGTIDVQVKLPHGPVGSRTLKAVGVQTGGRTLTLSAPITIKTEAECKVRTEGTTTTTAPGTPTSIGTETTTPTSTPTSTTPVTSAVSQQGGGGGGKPLDQGTLAFTGTDAFDLALIGGAAAIGGRALYGLARSSDDDEEDEE